jgi:hypothetical protein
MAPDLVQLKNAISVLTVPVYFLVAFVFYRRNLWRAYFFFWLSLLVEGAAVGATLFAGGNRSAILLIYTIAQPVAWILYILMVMELFQKLFVKFPGIARFAQRVVLISMIVAFVFALASIGGDLSTGWSGKSMIFRYSVIMRTISSALSVYMVLIACFLLWMPMPLPANTIRHSFLFFFYFFVTTGVYYVLNTTAKGFVNIANFVTSVLTLAALAAWYFLVQPEGEIVPALASAPRTSSSDMLGRLEALNRTLSRPQE